MRRIHFGPSLARLKWLRDSALIIGITFGVAIAVIPLSKWWHRSHNPDLSAMRLQVPADSDAAEAQAGPTGTPLLWVLKTPASTVYLFGAFNSNDPVRSGWMDRRLFEAFDNADLALFEVPAYPRILPMDRMMPRPDAFLFRRAKFLQKATGGLETGPDRERMTPAGISDDGFVLPANA